MKKFKENIDTNLNTIVHLLVLLFLVAASPFASTDATLSIKSLGIDSAFSGATGFVIAGLIKWFMVCGLFEFLEAMFRVVMALVRKLKG